MTVAGPEVSEAVGRPSAGALLAAEIQSTRQKRAKSKNVRALAGLFPLVLAHGRLTLSASAALIASTSLTLALPGVLRLAIDHGFQPADFALTLSVALSLAAATALRLYCVTRLGERVVADLRTRLYAHVLKLDQAWFLTIQTGEVLSRMTADMAIVESMAGVSLSIAARNLLNLIGALVLISVVSPKLTLGVVAIVPVVLLPLFIVGRRVRKLSVTAQDRFADAVAYAGESLDQLETVQAFGREDHAAARFKAAVEAAFSASLSRLTARSVMTVLVMALVFTGIAAVLWIGVGAVKSGEITNGALLQFLILAVLAAGSVGALGEVWGEVQKASGAMSRIQDLMAARPNIAAPADPVPLPVPARGGVQFENVSFAYPGRPDMPALNQFSLHVAPGERVALVGPSGAGKSTVFRLLLRFYDPTSGAVLIDGVDLRDADPEDVRARMAVVAQDAALFSGSPSDNIRFGRAEASLAEVRSAADAANATGFISALPLGFEHPIGERGRTLSGGQRQRIAIARALVRGAPILLLDEATSALDAESERLVQDALDRAMGDRTTLVIAHRLATVQSADRIVVMDQGQVVEEGRHAELIAKGGLYARLAKLQFGVEGHG